MARRKKGKSTAVPFVLLAAAVIGGIYFLLRYFFLESPFFLVKEIAVNKEEGLAFAEEEAKLNAGCAGENIFKVDLAETASMIMKDLPHLRKATVTRKFPDRLEIDVAARKAVAVMNAGRSTAIDKDGVILSFVPAGETLPEIRGIKFLLETPKPGERLKTQAVSAALMMIDILHKKEFTRKFKINFVDVSEKNNIVVGIDRVAVKMGCDDFTDKINKLSRLLDDPKIKLTDISYIDMRFKKPVIAPK